MGDAAQKKSATWLMLLGGAVVLAGAGFVAFVLPAQLAGDPAPTPAEVEAPMQHPTTLNNAAPKKKTLPKGDGQAIPDPQPNRPIPDDVAAAKTAFEAGDFDQALTLLDPLLADGGLRLDLADAWYWRGRAHLSAEPSDRPQAVADLERAVSLDDGFVRAHTWLAYAHVFSGNCEAAMPSLNRCVELQPDAAGHLFNRGHCHMDAKDPEAALADVTRGCELGHAPSCKIKGRIEGRMKWLEENKGNKLGSAAPTTESPD